MAMEVKLLQPVKVVCTDDLGETLVDIMQTAGYSRPLMVTDSFVGSMPLVVAARTKLEQVGVDVAVFDQVKPDPLCETVESGAKHSKRIRLTASSPSAVAVPWMLPEASTSCVSTADPSSNTPIQPSRSHHATV